MTSFELTVIIPVQHFLRTAGKPKYHLWNRLFGSLLIFIYAIFRRDPVLFVGHLSGLIIYSRNIYLVRRYGN